MSKNLKVILPVCIIIVLAGCATKSPSVGRGPDSKKRETGWSFLVKGQKEAKGYGLYSYVLFGSPPSSATRERYLRTIVAYLEMIPDITNLEEYFPRHRLNVTYLPINISPPLNVRAEWVLEHYDYARARFLLNALPGTHRDGPYIISYLEPLSGVETLSGQYLHQDLSSVDPGLVLLWVKEFLNQAAQERYWEAETMKQFVLKLREIIATLAIGLPDIREAMKSWIILRGKKVE